MPISFQFRWVPFVAMLIAVAIGISAGEWQMRRANGKQAIAAKLEQRGSQPPMLLNTATIQIDEHEYRRVIVKGEFVADWTLYLDNRPHLGAAGFHVLMPFKLAGSQTHVMIARGWLRRDVVDRTRVPPLFTPAGVTEITGVLRQRPGRLMQMGKAEPIKPNAIVQNLEIAEFSQASKLTMQPVIVEQLSAIPDGLVRDWPKPSTGVDKHLGYAFQWYALAAMAFIFFVVTGIRRGKK